jgi:CheY-like chemotaxis protein
MAESKQQILLGQLLLASGVITQQQLDEALSRQRDHHQALGQILLDMGAVTPRQLEETLRRQARLRGKPDHSSPSSPFILVVDDNPEVGAVVSDILASAGYQVGVAESEAEAISAFLAPDAGAPALIVLDLVLPREGGIELLAWLRGNDTTRDLPVVVLTGAAELQLEIQRRSLEISEFLVKPVPAHRLVEAAQTALRAGHAVSGARPLATQ